MHIKQLLHISERVIWRGGNNEKRAVSDTCETLFIRRRSQRISDYFSPDGKKKKTTVKGHVLSEIQTSFAAPRRITSWLLQDYWAVIRKMQHVVTPDLSKLSSLVSCVQLHTVTLQLLRKNEGSVVNLATIPHRQLPVRLSKWTVCIVSHII